MTVITDTTHSVTVFRDRKKIPARGYSVCGQLVYLDGQLVGALHSTAANAAHQVVLDTRGEYIELRYRPWEEIRTEVLEGSR